MSTTTTNYNLVKPAYTDPADIQVINNNMDTIDTTMKTIDSKVVTADATETVHGLMSTADKTKLDGVATNANNYSHPTGDGNLHVIATGTTNNGKVLTAGSTAGSMTWSSLPTSLPANGGSATTATKLVTARNITLTGDVTGSVSFDGSADASITAIVGDDSHQHTFATVTGLSNALLGKTPFSTATATTPATAGYYRIGSSAINIGDNSALVKVTFNGTNISGSALLQVSCHNGDMDSTELNQLSFSTSDPTLGLTKARLVCNTTPTGNYSYIEIYNPTALAITYTVDLIDAQGFSLLAPNTAGSIPSGYTALEILLDRGLVSSQDITALNQLISTVVTGTAPLSVVSTTKVPNLNVDLLDGYDTAQASTASTVAVRDASGNLTAKQLVSDIANGTTPMLITSKTKVANLNVDQVDGFDFDQSVKTTDSPTFVKATFSQITGTAPFSVVSTTKVASLNAEQVDGYDAGNANGNIPISNGTLNTNLNADKVDSMDAVSTNTPTSVVSRDASGNFSAGTITASLSGNSSTATKLATARNINGVLFDGSADITVADGTKEPVISTKNSGFNLALETSTANIKMDGTASVGVASTLPRADHVHPTDTSRSPVANPTFTGTATAPTFASSIAIGTPPLSVVSTTKVANLNVEQVDGYDATTVNTANTIAVRDGSNNINATTFTGALSGNATSSTTATKSTNVVGGSAGTIPYQSATDTTAMITAGSSGQALVSNGTSAPAWVTLDMTYMPNETAKKSVKVASTTDVGASLQSATTLTGFGTSQSLACTTTASSTTITTTATAGLKVGAIVSTPTTALAGGTTVASITDATHFVVNNRASILTTAITGTGSTATATFSGQTYVPFAVGSSITITGAVPSTYNGTFVVTACTSTSVSWASTEVTTATTQGTINFTIGAGTSLTTAFVQTISALVVDGITLALNDRVLLKNQSTVGGLSVTANRDNGIYYLSTLGSTSVPWVLTRTPDANTSVSLSNGLVAVDQGATNGGFLFDNDLKTTDTLGTTPLPWNSIADNGKKLSYFAPTSSSELASVISDETGSGALVFASSPTLVTPNIGVASGTSFNSITGLSAVTPSMDGTGAVGTATTSARADHVHPTDTTKAPIASPTFTGTATSPTFVGDLVLDQANIPTTGQYDGAVVNISACASTVAQYNAVTGNGTLAIANADATSQVLGITTASASSGASCKVLTHGIIRNTGWAFTKGALVYLSPTASGGLTQTKPATAGQTIVVVGTAIETNVLFVNPQFVWVTI